MKSDAEILKQTALLLLAVGSAFFVLHVGAAAWRRKPLQWARVFSQAGLYVGFLALVGAPQPVLACALMLCSFLAFRELGGAAAAKGPRLADPLMTLVYGGGMSPLALLWHYSPGTVAPYALVLTGALFAVPVFTGKFRDAPARIAYPLIGGLASVCWGFLVPLRDGRGGLGLTLFLLFVLNLSEMASYVLGRAFGRHRLAPTVSPKKTIEGTVLGALCGVALALALRGTLIPGLSAGKTALLATAVTLAGVLGDLITSVFKRDSSIKDYGTTIPGHGGMLDRFDGLLVAAPLFYYLTK
jgi:phosphatidate cytidylyltransferase